MRASFTLYSVTKALKQVTIMALGHVCKNDTTYPSVERNMRKKVAPIYSLLSIKPLGGK